MHPILRGTGVAGAATLLTLTAAMAPAHAATSSVPDISNDSRYGGPDIIRLKVKKTSKRVVANVDFFKMSDMAFVGSFGATTSVNLKFKNGKQFRLVRQAPSSPGGADLVNEIRTKSGKVVDCSGVQSVVRTGGLRATLSAPSKCFPGANGWVRAQATVAMPTYASDKTEWTAKVG